MPSGVTWDILIASVTSRAEKLHALLEHLAGQIEPGVGVIVYQDNCEATIGDKAQRLIDTSDAEYVCFVGDDDWVSDLYVPMIAEVLRRHRPDYVGFKSHFSHFDGEVIQSMNSDNWAEGTMHSHLPGTLSPIRREIAVLARFYGDVGEDRRWAQEIYKTGRIRDEVFIPECLYDYRWDPNDSVQTGTVPVRGAHAGPPPARLELSFVKWL